MDELLQKIKDELISQGVNGVRKGNIYITPDPNFIPQGVSMPCINIKDGKIKREYGASNSKNLTMYVRLTTLIKLTAKEAALVGSDKSGRQGILDINMQLITLLENNTLNIAGLEEAVVDEIKESRFYRGKRNVSYQIKELVMRYSKSI